MSTRPFDIELWDRQAARYDAPFFWSLWTRAWGDEYPADVQPYSSCTRTLLQQLLIETALGPGQLVVDLGCGTGGVSLWLARQTGARAFGLDVSQRAIHIARRRVQEWNLNGRVEFATSEFSRCGLEDGSVDCAVSIDALPFASDIAAAFAEASRILRRDGRLVFTSRGVSTSADPALLLGERWWRALGAHSFRVDRVSVRPDVPTLWLRLYEHWLANVDSLRAVLPTHTVHALLAEVSEVGPKLRDGRPFVLVTAVKWR